MNGSAAPSVYLDHNATTPVSEEVIEAMAQAQRSIWANPSSLHGPGASASYALEKARRSILKELAAPAGSRLVFTSGATEAANLAIRGVVTSWHRAGRRPHVICSRAEHKAVLETVHDIGAEGLADVSLAPVDHEGRPISGELFRAVHRNTALACVMLANNEVGTITHVPALAREFRATSHGIGASPLIFCDATQAIGKIPVNLTELGADLVAFSAHKFHGPKGVGALYIAPGIELAPQLVGGPQESGLRAGTQNVPAVIGMEAALKVALRNIAAESLREEHLREEFWQCLSATSQTPRRNSPAVDCLPNTLHFSVPGFDSRTLVMELDRRGYACSSGSACTSGGHEHSHVLLAMGLEDNLAAGALRLSLGPDTRDEHSRGFTEALVAACAALSLPGTTSK